MAREKSLLFEILRALARLLVDHLLAARRQLARAQLLRRRVFRRKDHAGGPVDRVQPRREDAHRLPGRLQPEVDLGALAAPDPVPLHRQHLRRPARLDLLHVLQELVRVRSDAQEPLVQLPHLHLGRLVPPAAAVHHLLVGQHRLALRAPVHQRALPVGQPTLEHPQKHPLVPAVVFRQAGVDLAVPVVGEAQPLELFLHVGDIRMSPVRRMPPVLDGRVLRRQPERVPPDRVHHVVAPHPLVARQRIADRVIPHVPHVQSPARIREHLQHVITRLRPVIGGFVQRRVRVPALAPFQLDFFVAVRDFRHSFFSCSTLR